MKIDICQTVNRDHLISLSGEMDALGCSEIRVELEKVIVNGQAHIILQLDQVSFIDSSGIGAIVFLFKRLKQLNRTLEICGVQGQPLELMTLLRIDAAIPMTLASAEQEQEQVQATRKVQNA